MRQGDCEFGRLESLLPSDLPLRRGPGRRPKGRHRRRTRLSDVLVFRMSIDELLQQFSDLWTPLDFLREGFQVLLSDDQRHPGERPSVVRAESEGPRAILEREELDRWFVKRRDHGSLFGNHAFSPVQVERPRYLSQGHVGSLWFCKRGSGFDLFEVPCQSQIPRIAPISR